MNNGCVCCTVRGDLIRVVEGLMKRQRPGKPASMPSSSRPPVLPTPVPVAQTFFMDDDVQAPRPSLTAVVALVDAKHLPLRLKDSREAEDQIAFADVVLLNKTDLVSPEELERIEATVRVINPSARIYRTQRSEIDARPRFSTRARSTLSRALENDPHFLDQDDHEHDHTCGPDCGHDHHDHHDHDHHHHHDHDHHHHDHAASPIHDVTVQSISLRGGEMNADRFFPWIQKITQTDGPNILRLKGIIAFAGDDRASMSCRACT